MNSRFSLQDLWREAWKRFWKNWVPATILIPLSLIGSVLLLAVAFFGVSATVESCSHRTKDNYVDTYSDNVLVNEAYEQLYSRGEVVAAREALGKPEYLDEFEEVVEYAEKKVAPAKIDSITNVLNNIDSIIAQEAQEEAHRFLQEEEREIEMEYDRLVQKVENAKTEEALYRDDELKDAIRTVQEWNLYSSEDELEGAYAKYARGEALSESDVRVLLEALENYKQRKLYDAHMTSSIMFGSAVKHGVEMRKQELSQSLEMYKQYQSQLESIKEEISKAKIPFIKKLFVWLASLIVLLLYVGVGLVGLVWFILGTDRVALSVAQGSVRNLIGDIIPERPLPKALHFILFTLIVVVVFIVVWFSLIFTFGVLSWILTGKFMSSERAFDVLFDFSFRGMSLAPLFFLTIIVFIASFYFILWPSSFLLLEGYEFHRVLIESVKFAKRNWQRLLLFDFSRLILFLLVSSVLAGGGLIFVDFDDFFDKGYRSLGGWDGLIAVVAPIGEVLLLSFMTISKAVVYQVLREEEAQSGLSSFLQGEEQPSLPPS